MGPDKRHIGDKYGFILLTPVGTSKGLKDVDTGNCPGDQWFDIEFEVRIEGNSLYFILGKNLSKIYLAVNE